MKTYSKRPPRTPFGPRPLSPGRGRGDRVVRCLLLGLLLSAAGCSEIELGDVPFLCNNGQPKCPEGYDCVGQYCIRQGMIPPDSTPWPDGVRTDGPTSDTLMWLDGPTSSDLPTSEGSVTKWDTGPDQFIPPDKGVTKPDNGWPPHIGCQSHSACTDSSSPCCCPLPIIKGVWACLPLCLNPFCL